MPRTVTRSAHLKRITGLSADLFRELARVDLRHPTNRAMADAITREVDAALATLKIKRR